MASEFCDWQPCITLKKFIEQRMNDSSHGLVAVAVIPRAVKPQITKVVFWYCPFCGTRLHDNKEVLKWIEENRK